MPRPRRCRKVFFEPGITYFKPIGVPMSKLEEVTLTVDELEAMRLKDMEAMNQEEVAERMGISQPTVHRLLESARKKITEAITMGKALRIEGGMYEVRRS